MIELQIIIAIYSIYTMLWFLCPTIVYLSGLYFIHANIYSCDVSNFLDLYPLNTTDLYILFFGNP